MGLVVTLTIALAGNKPNYCCSLLWAILDRCSDTVVWKLWYKSYIVVSRTPSMAVSAVSGCYAMAVVFYRPDHLAFVLLELGRDHISCLQRKGVIALLEMFSFQIRAKSQNLHIFQKK